MPADDIDRVGADIIASYSDPEHEAFARHERAWYRSDGVEQSLLVPCAEGRQVAVGRALRPRQSNSGP